MIHRFIFDGTRIVLDAHSGALHQVDCVTWDLLEGYQGMSRQALVDRHSATHGEEQVLEALDEIGALVDGGLLFSPDPLGGEYAPEGEGMVKALCLHVAHSCNLACGYCFAGQGKFGGDVALMSLEVGRRAMDLLLELSGPKRHVEVDFFGGEPLLNFEVVRQLVEYGDEIFCRAGKEIKYTLTTNAVLLGESNGDFLNKHNISVILSIDGREQIHDAMRPFPGGKGSYEMVKDNILKFLPTRSYNDYYVRGTYTAFNTDFCNDVRHLVGMGIRNISVEPAVALEGDAHALGERDLPVLLRQYEDLTRFLLEMRQKGDPVNFFHFNIDLEGGPCLHKRLSGCGAGHQYLAVDPEGKLYPCHQFVGQGDFLIGDVKRGIVRRDLVDYFRGLNLYSKKGCAQCWAKFFCSGGCHAGAYIYGGDINVPSDLACQLTKKRLECSLYLKIKEKDINLL